MWDIMHWGYLPASQEGCYYWMQMQLWRGSQWIWRTHQLWCPVMSNPLALQPWSLQRICRRYYKLAELQFLIFSISSLKRRCHIASVSLLSENCAKSNKNEARDNFIPSLKEVPTAMQMKMRERKIETAVWSRSECKVGTKKAKRP